MGIVCPGCEKNLGSQHALNLHLMNSEFCHGVDQCGVNINQPALEQHFGSGQEGDGLSGHRTKGSIPHEHVTDPFDATLGDNFNLENKFNSNGINPACEVDALPVPSNFLTPEIMSDRAKITENPSDATKVSVLLMHELMVSGWLVGAP